MIHLLRVVFLVILIISFFFVIIFYQRVNTIENEVVLRGIRLIMFMSIFIVGLFIVLDVHYKRVANRLREVRLYYNQLKSKMETEMAYSNVFSRINHLTKVFSDNHDLESVLRGSVKALKEFLGVNIITLQLYSDDEERFFMRVEEGDTDINLGENLITDVIEENKSRLINEVDGYRRYPELGEEGYKSIIVAPLTKVKTGTGSKSIGLIAALTRQRKDFTSQDLSLLTAFTHHASLIIQNAQLYLKTQELAIRDGLTNLYNHRHFKNKLDELIKKAEEEQSPVSLIISDIDNFKNYNDEHGHPRGDEILRQIADLLLDNTRGSDIVSRYGGEEFVIILPGTKKSGAEQLCRIIMNKIRDHDFPGDETQPKGHLTMTFGGAAYPSECSDAKELIEMADKRMYKGKEDGRDKMVMDD